MRSAAHRSAWAAVAVVACLGACHCGQPPATAPDAGLDAAPPDARPDRALWPPFHDAAPPDADLHDAWQPGPFPDAQPCDATFIKLPPTGQSYISVVSNWGRWVAYDYDETPSYYYDRSDVYLFDLETCTEHRITNDPSLMQWQPHVWENRVVFSNEFALNQYTITSYDISTNTFAGTSVMSPGGVAILGAIGDWVAYADSDGGGSDAPFNWRILYMPSGVSTFLQSSDDGASSGGDISETHFTWPSLVANEHAGIWVVDFATGQKRKLEATETGTYPSTWGDWVVWEDWRTHMPDIWGERLGSGERVHITDNGAYNGFPRLRGHLLCFRTTLWSGNVGWDLAVMDMDTWVVRRVTQVPSQTYRCGHVDGKWIVYRRDMNQFGFSEIYAKDLIRLGILDAQGHVVPE